MDSKRFDPSKVTVADLFRAKKERRQRLAQLPFEQKIEIVKKLQSVTRTIRAETHKVQDKLPTRSEAKETDRE